jgi:hypothetical protein
MYMNFYGGSNEMDHFAEQLVKKYHSSKDDLKRALIIAAAAVLTLISVLLVFMGFPLALVLPICAIWAAVYLIKLQNVDFGDRSPRTFKASAASGLRGGQIELRIDSIKGQCLATLSVPATGGWENWQTLSAPVNGTVSGTHDLFLVFTGRKGPKLFNLDWWEML